MAFIDSGKTFDKKEIQEKLKKRMENMDSASYLLKIPASLYKKVRLKLIEDDRKLKPVLIEMLEKYIKE
jgi:hypothetical protein